MVENLPVQEMPVQSLGQEDPLEKERATHSSNPAWRMPWIEESMEVQSQARLNEGLSMSISSLSDKEAQNALLTF